MNQGGLGGSSSSVNPSAGAAYRPEPTAPGLPLPRNTTWISVFTALAFAVAIIGTIVVLIGFAPSGMARHWMAIKEGGIAMYPLLLLTLVLPIILAVLSLFWIRGKALSTAGAMTAIALLPLMIASLAMFATTRKIEPILSAVSGSALPRIVAAATGELMNLHVLGDLTAGLACAVLAIGLGGGVASIDRKRVSPNPAGFAKVSWIIALVLASVWILSTFGLFIVFMRRRTMEGLSVVGLGSVVIIALMLVMVARGASALKDGQQASEARTHLALALLSCLAGIAALCLLEQSVVARTETLVFGAISGESVDPSQKARIAAELLPFRSHATCACGLHLLFGLATTAVVITPAIPKAHPITHHGITGALAIAVAIGLLLLSRSAKAGLLAQAKGGLSAAAAQISLPVAESTTTTGDASSSLRLLVQANGAASWESSPPDPFAIEESEAGSLGRSTSDEYAVPITIFADSKTTIDKVVVALEAEHRTGRRLSLTARGEESPDWASHRKQLGDLAPLVDNLRFGIGFVLKSQRGYVENPLDADLESTTHTLNVRGRSRSVSVKLGVGTGTGGDTYARRHNLEELAQSHIDQIRFTVRASETIANVVEALVVLEQAFQYHFSYGSPYQRIVINVIKP